MNRNLMLKQVILVFFLIPALFGAGCSKSQTSLTSVIAPASPSSHQAPAFDGRRLEGVLRDYFSKLDTNEYETAYGLLSDSFKERYPYLKWRDGYADTLEHAISSVGCHEDICAVTLIATEASGEKIEKQEYSLRYKFIKDERGEPLIDSGTLDSHRRIEESEQGFHPSLDEGQEELGGNTYGQNESNPNPAGYKYTPPFKTYPAYYYSDEGEEEDSQIEDGDHQVEACHDGDCYTLDAEVEDGVVTRINFPNGGYRDIDAELDENGEGSGADNDGQSWDVTIDE